MIDDNLKEGIHKKNAVWLDGRSIQENRLGGTMETVAVQDRLDHDEALTQVFPVEHVPVESGLVGAVVEYLQELRPTEVEHKLRVEGELLRDPETVGIVFRVFSKLLALLKDFKKMLRSV